MPEVPGSINDVCTDRMLQTSCEEIFIYLFGRKLCADIASRMNPCSADQKLVDLALRDRPTPRELRRRCLPVSVDQRQS